MGLIPNIGRPLAASASAEQPQNPPPGDDFWYADAPGMSAGVQVTEESAMKASAVFACVSFLAQVIASLPLRMRQMTSAGPKDAPNHPLEELLRYQPNPTNTSVEFIETIVLHAAVAGDGYAEIMGGARGEVDQLVPLGKPERTEMLPDRTLRFRFRDPVTQKTRMLLQTDLLRIPGLSRNGLTGLPIVELAADAIGLSVAADRYAAGVFSRELNPGTYIKHPQKLSPAAQKAIIQAFVEKLAGIGNSHRPIVLQEGMELVQPKKSARDAQLTEERKAQILEVARFFRIPPQYLGIYDGATHSNVEQSSIDLVKYTIRPWVKRIELAIRRDLIIATGSYFAEFNLEGLLRGDSAARAVYFAQALGSGGHAPWMTVNEVRRIEGYPDVDGGDELVLPSNKQTPEPGKPGQQPPPPPADDNEDPEDPPPADDPKKGARLPAPPAQITHTVTVDVGTDAKLPARVGEIAERVVAGVRLSASAQKLARIEVAALRRAAARHAGDQSAFRAWTVAFYGGHVSTVVATLGIDKETARIYCRAQRDAACKDLSPLGVDSTLTHWEEGLADEIVRGFKIAGRAGEETNAHG